IQVAQKKVKIAFENADSSSRVELIPSKIKRASRGGVKEEQFRLLAASTNSILLSCINDRWVWSLEYLGDYSVKSARSYIFDSLLPTVGVHTRWIKVVPIKINIFAWRVCLDKLPTRLNLSLRRVDIPSILSPLLQYQCEVYFASFIFLSIGPSSYAYSGSLVGIGGISSPMNILYSLDVQSRQLTSDLSQLLQSASLRIEPGISSPMNRLYSLDVQSRESTSDLSQLLQSASLRIEPEVSSEAVPSSQGTVEPHGSIAALAGGRAIAQWNIAEFSEALF
nr:RNA-directed DNA polymerase, eukaryota [Tanacetum cinerariifolium]